MFHLKILKLCMIYNNFFFLVGWIIWNRASVWKGLLKLKCHQASNGQNLCGPAILVAIKSWSMNSWCFCSHFSDSCPSNPPNAGPWAKPRVLHSNPSNAWALVLNTSKQIGLRSPFLAFYLTSAVLFCSGD